LAAAPARDDPPPFTLQLLNANLFNREHAFSARSGHKSRCPHRQLRQPRIFHLKTRASQFHGTIHQTGHSVSMTLMHTDHYYRQVAERCVRMAEFSERAQAAASLRQIRH